MKNLVILALSVAQLHMRDWKGKEATRTQEKLMNIQAKIMDIQEIPAEEFIHPPQLDMFKKEAI